jgi:DNA polymerase III epsilon subunit-like protein
MSKKRKLVVIDTETGGLDVNTHSLLSIAVLVWSEGAVEDEFYTLVNEGEIVADEQALKINGLSVERVKAEGVNPLQAVNAITSMLLKHDLRRDVRIVAHNAPFDVPYVKRLWRLAGRDFAKQFSYRSLCTQTGALLLEQAGRIDLPGGSASLDNLVKLWSIKLDRTGGHNALADAHACAGVLKHEIALIGGQR